jgi:hypothetical protein
MEWYEILAKVLAGLAVIIPLVAELVKYVKRAGKEENWTDLMTLVITLMKEAEDMFEHGADKKMWVMSMVSASAKTINYPVDLDKVSAWIDALCDMSKIVNAPNKE